LQKTGFVFDKKVMEEGEELLKYHLFKK